MTVGRGPTVELLGRRDLTAAQHAAFTRGYADLHPDCGKVFIVTLRGVDPWTMKYTTEVGDEIYAAYQRIQTQAPTGTGATR